MFTEKNIPHSLSPVLSLLLILLAPLLAGCLGSETVEEPAEITFCAEDAKVCPDGSTVSRVSPDCEFIACPASNPTAMPDTNTISITKLSNLKLDCPVADNFQTRCPETGDTVVKISTNHGEIWLRLFSDETPKTVENFTGLIERGYYDGIIFHRVIPDFMIQSGDPTGTGTGGASIWGTDFADEFVPKLKNIKGALSMANRGPATNSSQFFIVQAKAGTPHLDGRHTVFGQVFSGLSVVDEIATVEHDSADKPLQKVAMEKVETFMVAE